MGEPQHTPGPWTAWGDGRTVGIAVDGGPLAVAEVVDHGDMADPQQILADQRLIAAAPELLAAAVGWDGYVKGIADRNGDDEHIQRIYQGWRAAIAKARAPRAAGYEVK